MRDHALNHALDQRRGRAFIPIITLAIILCVSCRANACNPNEECSKCIASAFGHCIQHGNDPVCEARKAACRVAPPIVDIPGSPLAPSPLTPETVQHCVANPGHCPAELLARVTYQYIRPIVELYISYLMNQANGHWQSLGSHFIDEIQRFYSVDLRQVRFATGINTVHGQAITIGNNVFFPYDLDLSSDSDAALMYHELEHVVQYANRGGVEPFLAEYVLKSGGEILARRSFNVHDNVDLEHAAIDKASEVSKRVLYGLEFQMTNSCSHTIDVYIDYLNVPDASWHVTGYWRIAPSKKTFLEDNGQRLHSRNRKFAVYAEFIDHSYAWSGDLPETVEENGKTYKFRLVDESSGNISSLGYDFTCSGY
jgi:Domain of unknown function (DUF4157)